MAETGTEKQDCIQVQGNVLLILKEAEFSTCCSCLFNHIHRLNISLHGVSFQALADRIATWLNILLRLIQQKLEGALSSTLSVHMQMGEVKIVVTPETRTIFPPTCLNLQRLNDKE